MSDVEIIYIKREKEQYLKPDVSVYTPHDCKITNNSPKRPIQKEPKTKKPFFNPRKTFYLLICFAIIGVVVSSSFNAGFIPVKSFLEIKEPIGNAQEINVEESIERYSLPIKEIPTFENVKYKIYGTNQGKSVIEADYKDELKSEGYELKYSGTQNIKGFDITYYGFIKGLTAVVILTTSDDIYLDEYETLVLYSTGSVFDYAEILRDNAGLLKI